MKKLLGLAVLALALVCPGVAEASISYQYVTDATTYSGTTGSTVNVSVYLQETVSGTSTSILAAQNGLFDYGIYVAGNTSATGASTISNYTSAAPFTQFGTGINNNTSSAGQNPSGLPANSLDYYNGNNTQAANGTATANGYKVLVGTLAVTVGSTTTFTLTTQNNPSFLDPGNGGTAQSDNTHTLPASGATHFDLDANGTANGQSYTGANNAVYTFTVSAAASVPEPSSMLLCGLVAAGGAYTAYRRRKALSAAPAELAA